jgi:hypothetical protein
MTLPPNVPVADFWAITLYDTQTRSQLQTDQQFPTLDTYTKGLQKNADGSYDHLLRAEGAQRQGKQLAADRSAKKLLSFACVCMDRPSPGSMANGGQVMWSW